MRQIFILIIKIYQKILSPALHFTGIGSGCRFYPNCSQYCIEAIEKYGIFNGLFRGFKRIIKCHPFNHGGYDPC